MTQLERETIFGDYTPVFWAYTTGHIPAAWHCPNLH